jgi:LytS/YehU family sensor histidine kinase
MNPHFLFNAMSSIQNLIRKDEQEKADQYLGQFAGLMRKTLRNTSEEYIPLTDEIATLEHYCSLESLRQPFQYKFQVDERIDAHNTYIPSMILQPVIENAIIHGLAPQSGDRELLVTITPGKQGLTCTVTDTGIGVLASGRHPVGAGHQSMGMTLIRQRLELMGLDGEEHLTITDRSTLNPSGQGSVVSITIPTEQ